MAMRKTPPQTTIQTVRITARDAHTGKSKTITVYETTPEEVISEIDQLATKSERRRQPATINT